MRVRFPVPVVLLLVCLNYASASVRYVSLSSTNATPPYTDWSTAATNIQDAIDAASAGDTVLVTNGVYNNSGRIVYGGMSNRVAVTKPLSVQSVNGPVATVIEGYQIPGFIPCGDSAVRCAYLTNGAFLSGFTLTNGATRYLGDTNREDSGGGVWCESASAVVSNCIIVGNATADNGGGAMGGNLINCVLQSNRWAFTFYAGSGLAYGYGGGAAYSTLTSCTVASNSGALLGGGVFACALSYCVVAGNSTYPDLGSSDSGGGACLSTLTACTLSDNSAGAWGGGAYSCTLSNCLLTGNYGGSGTGQASAYGGGGGAEFSTLNNCTLTGNVGATAGGGASASFLTNCVLTNNSAPFGNGGGASGGTLSSCLVIANAADTNRSSSGGGTYNSTLLNCTLSRNTCSYSGGGAYGGFLSNCLVVSNVVIGGSGGGVSGGSVLNSCTLTGNSARTGGGAADATLNDCTIIGNQAEYAGGGAFSCIWCGGAPISTFLNNCTLIGNWAGTGGGGAAGCSLNGCLLSSNWVTTSNGGGDGGGAVYGCTVTNCVLLTNWTVAQGGGALDSALINCTLEGNAAWYGGGAAGCDLVNCALLGNSAPWAGATDGCALTNCTVANNSPGSAAAALGTILCNCILYFNGNSNYDNSSVLNDCCTTPLPPGGFDNVTNDPAFVDLTEGNVHLSSDSPCINSGNNAYTSGANDLDGNPRIVGGTVDMGAYEYQSPTSIISYAWLQQYGLPTDGSADLIDSDGDGMNNWQEWVAGTDPTDASSVLKMYPPAKTPPGVLLTWNSDAAHAYFLQRASSPANPHTAAVITTNVPGLIGRTTYLDSDAPGMTAAFYRVGTSTTKAPTPIVVQPPVFIPASVLVTWMSVTNRSYLLQRSTNLTRTPAFITVQSNLTGQAGTTSFMDTNAVAAGPYLYRVVVQR